MTATLDIAATRRALEQRRAALVAERPGIALAAAGGDPGAIADARAVAEELSDIAVQLEGLDLAAAEARRLDAVRQQQQAERARQERAEHVADLRATLGAELAALETVLVDIGLRVVGIDALARELDGLEATPTTPAYRRRYAAVRVVGRTRAALRCWAELLPGGQDPKPLGPDDVPR